nr:hypothetical protein [Tanacetum cinerariifolium]
MRNEKSLNVTFDDKINEPIVQDLNGSSLFQVNVSDEGYLKCVKEARGHPIKQVISEFNERTPRTYILPNTINSRNQAVVGGGRGNGDDGEMMTRVVVTRWLLAGNDGGDVAVVSVMVMAAVAAVVRRWRWCRSGRSGVDLPIYNFVVVAAGGGGRNPAGGGARKRERKGGVCVDIKVK